MAAAVVVLVLLGITSILYPRWIPFARQAPSEPVPDNSTTLPGQVNAQRPADVSPSEQATQGSIPQRSDFGGRGSIVDGATDSGQVAPSTTNAGEGDARGSLPIDSHADVVHDHAMKNPIMVKDQAALGAGNDPNGSSRLVWREIEGLVAVRNVGETNWSGPNNPNLLGSAWNIHVFPGSWCELTLGNMGFVTVGRDTHVAVTLLSPSDIRSYSDAQLTTEPQPVVRFTLDYGGLMLNRQSQDSWVELVINHIHFAIKVMNSEAVIGVDGYGTQPRLWVKSGKVQVNAVTVESNQQVVLDHVELLQVSSWDGRPEWWEKEPFRSPLSTASRERLLCSDDVLADLTRLGQEGSRQQKILANHFAVTLAPESQAMKALESTDGKVRETVIAWLLALPPDSRQANDVWQELTAVSGRPIAIRAIRSAALDNRRGTPALEPEQLRQLIDSLVHSSIGVRHLAAVVLEQRFGNPVGYRPDANLSTLQRNQGLWAAWIQQQTSRQRAIRQN